MTGNAIVWKAQAFDMIIGHRFLKDHGVDVHPQGNHVRVDGIVVPYAGVSRTTVSVMLATSEVVHLRKGETREVLVFAPELQALGLPERVVSTTKSASIVDFQARANGETVLSFLAEENTTLSGQIAEVTRVAPPMMEEEPQTATGPKSEWLSSMLLSASVEEEDEIEDQYFIATLASVEDWINDDKALQHLLLHDGLTPMQEWEDFSLGVLSDPSERKVISFLKEKTGEQVELAVPIETPQWVIDQLIGLQDLWATPMDKIGKFKGPPIHIPHNGKVTACPRRRYQKEVADLYRAEIRKLRESGVVKPSDSPFSSPTVLVTRDGKKRLCQDMRAVNANILPEDNTSEDMQTAFMDLAGMKFFTVLDVASAFQSLVLDEESQRITAFLDPDGNNWQYTRLPFGLVCSPRLWRKAISTLMNDFKSRYENEARSRAYVDDMLLMTALLSLHYDSVLDMLRALQEAGIKIGSSKAQLFGRTAKYLGYVIDEFGRSLAADKAQAIANKPPPKSWKQLRSLVATFGAYRGNIPHFSELVEPLQSLMREASATGSKTASKKKPAGDESPAVQTDSQSQQKPRKSVPAFEKFWRPEHARTVQLLQQAFAHTIRLAHVDFNRELFLASDASNTGWGGVLFQYSGSTATEKQVLAVVSGSFDQQQLRNLSASDRELAAIINCTQRLRHFFKDTIKIFTDHAALQNLKTVKGTSPKLYRWALALSPWHLSVVHIPGSQNLLPDLLSRTDFNSEEAFSLIVQDMRFARVPDPPHKWQSIDLGVEDNPLGVRLYSIAELQKRKTQELENDPNKLVARDGTSLVSRLQIDMGATPDDRETAAAMLLAAEMITPNALAWDLGEAENVETHSINANTRGRTAKPTGNQAKRTAAEAAQAAEPQARGPSEPQNSRPQRERMKPVEYWKEHTSHRQRRAPDPTSGETQGEPQPQQERQEQSAGGSQGGEHTADQDEQTQTPATPQADQQWTVREYDPRPGRSEERNAIPLLTAPQLEQRVLQGQRHDEYCLKVRYLLWKAASDEEKPRILPDDLRDQISKVKERKWDQYAKAHKPEQLSTMLGDYRVSSKGTLLRLYKGFEVIVIPKALFAEAVRTYHCSGHFSGVQTFAKLSRSYWAPNLHKAATTFAEECEKCQFRTAQPSLARRMGHVDATNWNQKVMIDYVTIPRKPKNDHLLVIVDVFSRYTVLVMTMDETAEATVDALFRNYFAYFGAPAEIRSDNGTSFQNDRMRQLCRHFDIVLKHGMPYSPQSQGLVEKTNGVIVAFLTKISRERGQSHEHLLSAIQMALNSRRLSALGMHTPLEVVTGTLMAVPRPPEESAMRFYDTRERQAYLTFIRKEVREAEARHVDEIQRRYNEGMLDNINLEVGELVSKRVINPEKTEFTYEGPYRVARRLDPNGVAYEIQLLEKRDGRYVPLSKLARAHSRQLKRFRTQLQVEDQAAPA